MDKKKSIMRRIKSKIEVSYEIADEIVNMLMDFDASRIVIRPAQQETAEVSANA